MVDVQYYVSYKYTIQLSFIFVAINQQIVAKTLSNSLTCKNVIVNLSVFYYKTLFLVWDSLLALIPAVVFMKEICISLVVQVKILSNDTSVTNFQERITLAFMGRAV